MLARIKFSILELVLPEIQTFLGVELRTDSFCEVFVWNFTVFVLVEFSKQQIELLFGQAPTWEVKWDVCLADCPWFVGV